MFYYSTCLNFKSVVLSNFPDYSVSARFEVNNSVNQSTWSLLFCSLWHLEVGIISIKQLDFNTKPLDQAICEEEQGWERVGKIDVKRNHGEYSSYDCVNCNIPVCRLKCQI